MRRPFVLVCGVAGLLHAGCEPPAPIINFSGKPLHSRTPASEIKVVETGVPDRGYLEFGAIAVECSIVSHGGTADGAAPESGCSYERALTLAKQQASAVGGDGLFHIVTQTAANGNVASLHATAFRYSSMGEEFPNLPQKGETLTAAAPPPPPAAAAPDSFSPPATSPPEAAESVAVAAAPPTPVAAPPPEALPAPKPIVTPPLRLAGPARRTPPPPPPPPAPEAMPLTPEVSEIAPPPPPRAAVRPAPRPAPVVRETPPPPIVRETPRPLPVVRETPPPPPPPPLPLAREAPPPLPAAPAAAPPPLPSADLLPAQERLARLKELRDKHMIPAEMYERRRKAILLEMKQGAK